MGRYRASQDSFAAIDGGPVQHVRKGTEFTFDGTPAPDWQPLDAAAAQALAPVLAGIPLGGHSNGFEHWNVENARAVGWTGSGNVDDMHKFIRAWISNPTPVS